MEQEWSLLQIRGIRMANYKKRGYVWQARVRRAGKSISRTFTTKARAEAWAQGLEVALRNNQPVPEEGVTVRKLIAEYRRLRDHARPIPDTSNEHYMLQHLEQDLGAKRAAHLTIDELVSWARDRAAQGAGPYTVNMELSKLGTVIRYAFRHR